MADSKLSNLPAASSVSSADLFYSSKGLTSVKVTAAQLATFIGGGGSTTPGGSTTQVQYNNAGAFGGITGATSNGTTLTLTAPVLGTPASVTLTNATGLPLSSGVTGNLPVANLASGTGASSTTFWRGDGVWGTPAGGGGGTPGGSTTQLQYNNAGAFGGITGATSNGTALTLVAPVLGTPASGTLTNCTSLPLSTGVTGNLTVSHLNSGTSASNTTFWRGDGTWATPAGGGGGISDAPNDGTQYGRQSLSWTPITGGGGGGTTILDGSGPPANSLGSVGDYYVDSDNGVLYGPKGSGFSSPENIQDGTVIGLSYSGNYVLGNDFSLLVPGRIVGARFFLVSGSYLTTRNIKVFDTATQTLLASAATVEPFPGWITVTFATPVTISAPTTVTVTIDVDGTWAYDTAAMTVTNSTHAVYVTGRNGAPGTWPTNLYSQNYTTDLIWEVAVSWPIAVSMTIGGAVKDSTPNSVLYIDSVSSLAQNNARFSYDPVTNYLKLGEFGTFGTYYLNGVPGLYQVHHSSGDNWFEGNAGNRTLTGFSNFGTGDLSLSALTTGSNNTAIGTATLSGLTSGSGNAALGANVMQNLTSGDGNFAMGVNALQHATTAGTNVAIGPNAGINMVTGDANVFIGSSVAAEATSGNQNIALGNLSMFKRASGDKNICMGWGSGYWLSSGSNNVLIGSWNGGSSPISFNNVIALSDGGNAVLRLNYNFTTADYWTADGNFALTAGHGFAAVSKAGAPAASDIPSGTFAVIDDTSGGQTWLVFNKAGTIRKVQLT